MKTFAIVKRGIIANIIRSNEAFAKSIGAFPMYEGAAVGQVYYPITITPADLREEAYNTRATIEWGGEMLTVTQAAQLWQYYAAEGSEKAAQLQVLIAQAKAAIREEFPDEEDAV